MYNHVVSKHTTYFQFYLFICFINEHFYLLGFLLIMIRHNYGIPIVQTKNIRKKTKLLNNET